MWKPLTHLQVVLFFSSKGPFISTMLMPRSNDSNQGEERTKGGARASSSSVFTSNSRAGSFTTAAILTLLLPLLNFGLASASSVEPRSPYSVRSQTSSRGGLPSSSGGARHLFEFIPTFSEDGTDVDLPLLSLQLRGTGVASMSADAYDAIQNAMNGYLRDVLGAKWGTDSLDPTAPVMTDARTEIVAERTLNGTDTRRGLRTLQDAGDDGGPAGVEVDLRATLTFRDAGDGAAAGDVEGATDIEFNDAEPDSESTSSSPSSASVPSQEALEGAAGDVWNDLSTFETVYLADVLSAEDESLRQEFASLDSMTTAAVFPTSAPASPGTAPPVALTAPTEAPTATPAPTPARVVAGINDSAVPPPQQDGMNPLWPALIVGIAVFLCTIIVLGIRRQRHIDDLIGNKSDPSIHVHDNMTLEGDEEIEVEDRLFAGAGGTEDRDDAAEGIVYLQPPDVSDFALSSGIDDDRNGAAGVGGYRRSNRASSRPSGVIASPRNSMQQHREDQSPPSSSRILEVPPTEDYDTYATMDATEKRAFLTLIRSGMSVPDASEQILIDRQHHPAVGAGSGLSGERRSLGGGRMSASARQKLQSEIMADGQTMVHIPQHLADNGVVGPSAQPRQYTPSMLMSEASSVASSFDDREYLQVGDDGAILTFSGTTSTSSSNSRRGKGGRRRMRAAHSSASSSHSGDRGGTSTGRPLAGGGRNILCNPELGI